MRALPLLLDAGQADPVECCWKWTVPGSESEQERLQVSLSVLHMVKSDQISCDWLAGSQGWLLTVPRQAVYCLVIYPTKSLSVLLCCQVYIYHEYSALLIAAMASVGCQSRPDCMPGPKLYIAPPEERTLTLPFSIHPSSYMMSYMRGFESR